MNILLLICLVLLCLSAGFAAGVWALQKKSPKKPAAAPSDSPWREIAGPLTMERVAVAYDTHDDRKVRYAFGRFQFRDGKLTDFYRDGNEQPKRIRRKNLLCWMPIPDLPQKIYDRF